MGEGTVTGLLYYINTGDTVHNAVHVNNAPRDVQCNVLGMLIQDQTTKPTSKAAFWFLSAWNTINIKGAVAKSRHVCHELIIGEVAVYMLVICCSYFS